ncbi:hypothetical protein ACFWG6_01340 [Streptomyces erythrochromogenes]|uniref:hypothetical protein n=1 Tax=Streptomyces erythrochromogenes TaxID=285574 RepID=UPI003629A798
MRTGIDPRRPVRAAPRNPGKPGRTAGAEGLPAEAVSSVSRVPHRRTGTRGPGPQGLGDDDVELAPGARVFDLTRHGPAGTAEAIGPVETATFGGPQGRFFTADGLLFSSSEDGLEIWDPATGARLGTLPGFRPTHHDPVRGELVELSAIGLRHWRTPTGPQAVAPS